MPAHSGRLPACRVPPTHLPAACAEQLACVLPPAAGSTLRTQHTAASHPALFSALQVLTWVLSYDGQHSPEPLAITAAGAALAISGGAPRARVQPNQPMPWHAGCCYAQHLHTCCCPACLQPACRLP